MARRVFFSFHFEGDIWRVNQIRNTNVVAGPDRAGFYDHSEYEDAKKKGDDEIRRLIREKLNGTTVTVVLIGEKTASRPYVRHEIDQSVERNNGLLGIFIDHMKDPKDPWYVPILSDIASALTEFLPFTPEIPKAPKHVSFPCYRWDGNVERFKREIEDAGKRSDELRAQSGRVRSTFATD